MKDSYSIRNLLNRLILLIEPSNPRIDQIKEEDLEAKETIKTVTLENETYNARLDELNKNIKELLGFKDAIVPIGKEYINVISSNNLPFDMAAISQVCKSIVEEEQSEIEDITLKIEDNTKKKVSAEKVVGETDIRLKEEEEVRLAVKSLIDTALVDGDEITKSRISTTIAKLHEFTDEEIKSMLPAILFPEQGLRAAYNEYDENKGKSTREMLKEAIQNQDMPIDESVEVKEETENKEEVKEEKVEKKEIDLDAILSKAKKNSKVEKVEKKEEKKIEEPKVEKKKVETVKEPLKSEEDKKKDLIKSELKVTDEDLKLTPQIMEMSLNDLEKAITYAKANDVDPSLLNLRTYCNDNLKQFVDNILLLRKNNLPIDDQQIAKHPYLGVVATDRVSKDITIVSQSGLSLVKRNGKVALEVVSREPKKLKSAISLIAPIDFSYFLNNPENMAKIIGNVAARLTYCQQNGINYKTSEGNFESFIENENEFNEIYGTVDTSLIPSAKECNKALLENVENSEIVSTLNDYYKNGTYLDVVELNQEQMDKFYQICSIVDKKREASEEYEIIIDNEKFFIVDFQKNLSYLISLGINATDNDLIMASLLFSAHKNVEAVKTVANKFDPNTMSLAA